MSMDVTEDDKNEPKRKGGPGAFIGEVRAEARKVTWATRNEVVISTIMVLIMVLLASVFFFVVDTAFGFIVSLLLPSRS